MLRKVASKVAWVGRTASMVFGLALVLALLFGTVTVALGATGGNFILGKLNSAGATTQLTSAVAGPVLKLVNNGTSTVATALNLSVPAGRAPLTVNSSAGKATNLNADKLDGQDASTIGRELWAVVGSDGALVRGSGASSSGTNKLQTGAYVVQFNQAVSGCAYVVTTTNGSAGQTGTEEGVDAGGTAHDVVVFTTTSNGTAADVPFHLIVTC